MTKIHLRDPFAAVPTGHCGIVSVNVTDQYTHTTCVLCRKRCTEKTFQPPIYEVAYVDQVVADPDAADDAPAIQPFVIDAHRWQAIRDRCGCGSCEVCRFLTQLAAEAHSDPWRATLRARAEKRTTRWASIGAALEAYVGHKADGYPVKGWGGTLEVTRMYGTFLQGGTVGTAAPQRAAHDVADMHRVLRSVARDCVVTIETTAPALDSDTAEVRTITGSSLVAILLACSVGRVERVHDGARIVQRYTAIPAEEVGELYGLSAKQVRKCARQAKRHAATEAERRGLIPAKEAAS